MQKAKLAKAWTRVVLSQVSAMEWLAGTPSRRVGLRDEVRRTLLSQGDGCFPQGKVLGPLRFQHPGSQLPAAICCASPR